MLFQRKKLFSRRNAVKVVELCRIFEWSTLLKSFVNTPGSLGGSVFFLIEIEGSEGSVSRTAYARYFDWGDVMGTGEQHVRYFRSYFQQNGIDLQLIQDRCFCDDDMNYVKTTFRKCAPKGPKGQLTDMRQLSTEYKALCHNLQQISGCTLMAASMFVKPATVCVKTGKSVRRGELLELDFVSGNLMLQSQMSAELHQHLVNTSTERRVYEAGTHRRRIVLLDLLREPSTFHLIISNESPDDVFNMIFPNVMGLSHRRGVEFRRNRVVDQMIAQSVKSACDKGENVGNIASSVLRTIQYFQLGSREATLKEFEGRRYSKLFEVPSRKRHRKGTMVTVREEEMRGEVYPAGERALEEYNYGMTFTHLEEVPPLPVVNDLLLSFVNSFKEYGNIWLLECNERKVSVLWNAIRPSDFQVALKDFTVSELYFDSEEAEYMDSCSNCFLFNMSKKGDILSSGGANASSAGHGHELKRKCAHLQMKCHVFSALNKRSASEPTFVHHLRIRLFSYKTVSRLSNTSSKSRIEFLVLCPAHRARKWNLAVRHAVVSVAAVKDGKSYVVDCSNVQCRRQRGFNANGKDPSSYCAHLETLWNSKEDVATILKHLHLKEGSFGLFSTGDAVTKTCNSSSSDADTDEEDSVASEGVEVVDASVEDILDETYDDWKTSVKFDTDGDHRNRWIPDCACSVQAIPLESDEVCRKFAEMRSTGVDVIRLRNELMFVNGYLSSTRLLSPRTTDVVTVECPLCTAACNQQEDADFVCFTILGAVTHKRMKYQCSVQGIVHLF